MKAVRVHKAGATHGQHEHQQRQSKHHRDQAKRPQHRRQRLSRTHDLLLAHLQRPPEPVMWRAVLKCRPEKLLVAQQHAARLRAAETLAACECTEPSTHEGSGQMCPDICCDTERVSVSLTELQAINSLGACSRDAAKLDADTQTQLPN